MLNPQASVPLLSLSALFLSILLVGLLLCLPFYKFNFEKLAKGTLFIKVMMWVPIFAIFVGCLYLSNIGRLLVVLILLAVAWRDLHKRFPKHKPTISLLYFAGFAFALLHFYFLGFIDSTQIVNYLIIVAFGSVVADVTAFFFGRYAGRHKLPATFNNQKSWEGVAGQILGAGLGVLLINWFVLPVNSLLIFLPIGVGAAIGDLTNSYIKRKTGIKDWGQSIPGHGGYLDRFCSLAGSFCLTYYWLLFF